MSVEQTLTRQRILLRETSQYLKRDFRKYIFNALGMWVWIFNLNLNKGDKYRSTYYFFRNIDDVLDGDRDVEENPLDYANSIKMAIEKEVFDFNRYPILQTAQTSLEYLERVKKPGDQPKELMIQLIDAIISDHLRIKHRKVLSQAELLEEYRKQFYPMHNLQLICVGSNVGFQEDVDYFPIFQARVQSLSDLQIGVSIFLIFLKKFWKKLRSTLRVLLMKSLYCHLWYEDGYTKKLWTV